MILPNKKLWLPSRRSFIRGAAAAFVAAPSLAQDIGISPSIQKARFAYKLPNWSLAALAVIRQEANATILYIGDSTAREDVGAATGLTWTDAIPRQLAAAINSAICPSVCDNFIGTGALTVANDNRFTYGSWGGAGGSSLGGPSIFASAAATLTFAPTVAFDTIDVFFERFGSAGVATIDIGGGTLLTINGSGTIALIKQSVSCSLGVNTINAKWVSSSNLIVGFNTYNSSTKKVIVLNTGWAGATSTSWNQSSAAYSPLNAIASPAVGQCLTILDGPEINDWQTSIAVATTKANVQNMITKALSVGDCILMTPNTTSGVSIATQKTYVAAIQQLAASNPACIFIDQWTNTFGGAYQPALMADSLHPNSAGIAAKVAAIMPFIQL